MSHSDPVCDHGLAQSQTAHAKSLLDGGELIDHLASLPDTLAAAHTLIQQQQRVIAQLSQELYSQQTRLAQQEQEQLQSARLLEQTQANCQDLRARLKRQQQQTLQFKAALEQCIDSCGVHKHSQPEAAESSLAKAALQAALEATAPSKPEQPIQPWSVSVFNRHESVFNQHVHVCRRQKQAVQSTEMAFYSQPATDKLTALSARQTSQPPARRPQRSAFARIDLPTFPHR
jgi:small-conductance mechanosensitive channel